MSDRTFSTFDATLCVAARTGIPDRVGVTWDRPDYETWNRIRHALEAGGFSFALDPWIDKGWPSLNKSHAVGRRATPHGDLFVATETYPTGCKFEFFQEVVTVNRNGGRYDFDRREKMPYLIRKAFEAAMRRARAHLEGRGFTETTKLDSPNPDPLAYFNAHWDGDYERRRGTHRFERDETGWPSTKEIGLACWTNGRPLITHGAVRYFRDFHGRLMRGRCYGGINGMWMVVYGPGRRDYTNLSRHELFDCDPRILPRRLYPRPAGRLQSLLKGAVAAEQFERAIILRDALRRLQPAEALAA
jgi:hypothetical protein